MGDNINADGILKDIMEVLSKYSIPVHTIAVDISLLPQEFENFAASHDPSRSATGVFYKSLALNNNIPATLRVKRRLPFDEIASWLESNILPILQTWQQELEHDFVNMQFRVNATRSINSSGKHFYNIYIECRPKESSKPDYGDLLLSVYLNQYYSTSYPCINANVARLVDEESEGDWGHHRIATLFYDSEVNHHLLGTLKVSLPQLYQALRTALGKLGVK